MMGEMLLGGAGSAEELAPVALARQQVAGPQKALPPPPLLLGERGEVRDERGGGGP